MKTTTLCFVICALFLLHAAGHAESRRHRDDRRQPSYKLFVFGDTFVDNGNTDKEELSWWTRNWYKPYGMSFANHSNSPTGRFSNGKVQSDFVANILGYGESPAPENQREDGADSFGMNFAAGFAKVKSNDPPDNFDTQIGRFRRLLRHGVIDRDISKSVALVGFSGYDYVDIPDQETDHDGFVKFIDGVTDALADGVSDILDLGVTKVLVNILQPMGCSPRYTRTTTGYNWCIRDDVTDIHNRKVKEKLGSEDAVLLLDLNTAFNVSSRGNTYRWLQDTLPCCESMSPEGYCGQLDRNGGALFELCDQPDRYFYFDEWHPSQAGWKAVMAQLEGPIKEFLGISS